MYNVKISLLVILAILSMKSMGLVCTMSSSYSDMFTNNNRSSLLARGIVLASQESNVKMNNIYYGDGSDVDFIEKINLSVKNGCKVILGIYTSRECLLAGPILKKYGAIAISPTCGHNDILKYYPFLFTAVPKIEDYGVSLSGYINNSNADEIFIFYQSTVYSRLFYNKFKKIKNKKIRFVKLDKDGHVKDKKIDLYKVLKKDTKKLILFTTYPLSSAPILEMLKKVELGKTIIVGATSWIFDLRIIEKFKKDVFLKAKKTLVTDIIDYEKIKLSSYYKKYQKVYSSKPDLLSVYSYDISLVVFKCIKEMAAYSSTLFINCLNSIKHKGVSGEIYFSKGRPFAQRKIKLYDLIKRLN